MFPAPEPFASGMLLVTDGNQIYWEASGNPHGQPAIYLHGGPGGGMGAGYRRRFDPERFLIVGFEQRGCGRSRPLAIDDLSTLHTNTTQALIADMEALRQHLKIDRWLLNGVSWGTTLALAYAQQHPERVSAIVCFAIATTSPEYVRWITETVGLLFPREWAQFVEAGRVQPGQRVVDAYYDLLTSSDTETRQAAAKAWNAWEDTHITLDPGWQPGHTLSETDDQAQQNFATLVTHYWKHAAFLPSRGLLDRMDALWGIPGVLIHGRYDVSGPTGFAWELHQAWPGSQFILVDDEGHGGPKMVAAMTEANSAFAAGR